MHLTCSPPAACKRQFARRQRHNRSQFDMKKRHLYLLLFGLPALLASAVVSVVLFGAVAGLAWLFVLGDDPWPQAANRLLVGVFTLSCLGLWLGLMTAAYRAGKKQEHQPAATTMALPAALGATALLLLLVVLHQWSVGNIGARSAGDLCSDFCQGKGFSGSGMPAKNLNDPSCSCFDLQGREALKVPLDEAGKGGRR
jgi:hypothetical protein